MRRGWWSALVAVIGCGDGAISDDLITAHSGDRLALSWYRFADGTELLDPHELYDRVQHTRCAPARWTDGEVRCVPIADDAVFVDPACDQTIGLAITNDEPSHFLARAWRDGVAETVGVFHAGAELATPPPAFFRKVEDRCEGPFAVEPETTVFAVGVEVVGAELAVVREVEVGGGRVALIERRSDDGLRAPIGARDHALGVACVPTPRPDGSAECEPAGAAPAGFFRDAACERPVVVVEEDAPDPTVARVELASGCPQFRQVGAPLAEPLYRRDGDQCRLAAVNPGTRAFAVDAPLEVPVVARAVEDAPDRRLRRIVLASDGLRFHDTRLVDTAIDADCVPHTFVDGVTRCVPATVATARRLFTASCVVEVTVTELPPRACVRPTFAAATTELGFELRAIGDLVSEPLFQVVAGQCRPYVAAAGATLFRLGPPVDPTAFAPAIRFGAR